MSELLSVLLGRSSLCIDLLSKYQVIQMEAL